MGNKDPREANRQQVNSYSRNEPSNNGVRQQRVGLTPTDGRDAYKRASTRSSRRSRSERTSYLMATGHLDIEETQNLNQEPSNEFVGHPKLGNNVSPYQPPTATTQTTTPSRAGPSNLEQNFIDYASSRQFIVDDNILAQSNVIFSKQPNANKSKNSSRGNSKSSGDNRNKFRQTYTEVALPMKTSPAFEYILKDNKRRNRRCCLWLLYSTLMIVCIAIIVFCGTHLALRYHNK